VWLASSAWTALSPEALSSPDVVRHDASIQRFTDSQEGYNRRELHALGWHWSDAPALDLVYALRRCARTLLHYEHCDFETRNVDCVLASASAAKCATATPVTVNNTPMHACSTPENS
jgi:hypothetical protein